jgi:hypothetical protein
MADAKTDYSDGVMEQKNNAKVDLELAKKIKGGYARKEKYGVGWAKVNFNELIERLTPGTKGQASMGKIIYVNQESGIAIVADVSGYVRVEDISRKTKGSQYLDIYGNDVHNFVDEKGKQHGRSKAEFNRLTHYIIKKREEM